jgi:rhamnose utilization protein RhaD (predicted bifunctional aldolase and dehydrogenase)
MKKEILKDFYELCAYAGRDPEFVQGIGGNVSCKDGPLMYIKASGLRLSEVKKKKGYAVYDLKKEMVMNNKKPSMELSFHKMLGKYVIHTHALAVLALVCMKNGKKVFKQIFPENKDHYWVGFKSPGLQLANAIRSLIAKNNINIKKANIIFTKNHGLIISAGSKEQAVRLHNKIIKILEGYFNIKSYALKASAKNYKDFISPDHLIYTKVTKQKAKINRFNKAVSFVVDLILEQKEQVDHLSKTDALKILNDKNEKYRQKFMKK